MPAVIAKTEIDRKIRRRFPGVLNVDGRIRGVLHSERLKREIASAGARVAKQVIREPVACVLPVEREISSGCEGRVLAECRAIVISYPRFSVCFPRIRLVVAFAFFASIQSRPGLPHGALNPVYPVMLTDGRPVESSRPADPKPCIPACCVRFSIPTTGEENRLNEFM